MIGIDLYIESIVFASQQPVSTRDIKNCLQQILGDDAPNEIQINTELQQLEVKYQQLGLAFELVCIGGGYQFLSKQPYHKAISVYLNQTDRRRLSPASMETLAIIAYKQPITKTEVEQIRGVNCDHSIQKLLEKELVKIIGRSDAPGRPLLYGTSQLFMDYFGMSSVKDLPQLRDIKPNVNEIGLEEESDISLN